MFGGFGSLPKKGKSDRGKLGPIQGTQKPPSGAPPKGPTGPTGPTVRVKPETTGKISVTETNIVDYRVDPMSMGDARPTRFQVNRARVGKGNAHLRDVTRGPTRPAPRPWRRWASRFDFEAAREEGQVGIKWTGPLFDESGYGEACRNYLAALHTSGFPVSSRAVSFGEPNVDYGLPGEIALKTLNVGINCGVSLVYAPPPFWKTHVDPMAYNIGMFVWETNRLPSEWVPILNDMDEVWVPCRWNAKVCKASGVQKPVFAFGHCLSPDEYGEGPSLMIPTLDASVFKFYSIFQWTERKNPAGLLRAYLSAFTNKDPVVLILKTYGKNYSQEEERVVRGAIEGIRREFGGDQPKIMLITKILSKAQILGLHRLGDCFVLPHRSEGWGLPHFEACFMGKPVITTNYGGNTDFTKPEHSYLADSTLVRISGMPWFKEYTSDMTWADVDVKQVRNFMRHVYQNREDAKAKGEGARRFVNEHFSWSRIGEAIKGRLKTIVKSL